MRGGISLLPLLLLLLSLHSSGLVAAARRMQFALQHATAGRSVLWYRAEDGQRMSHAVPLVYGGPRSTNATLLAAHGQTELANFDMATVGSGGLVLGAAVDSGMGARWRYVAWDNATLVLSSTLPPVDLGKMQRFACTPASAADGGPYCDLGVHTIAFAGNASMPDVRVVIDPDQPRGSLPSLVYFMLTNGRAAAASADDPALVALARATQCIRPVPGLVICDSDVGQHFKLDTASSSSSSSTPTIVIGGTYWHSRFGLQAVDQWTSTVYAAAATAGSDGGGAVDDAAVQIGGVVVAYVVLVGLYGVWLTSKHASVSYAAHVEHLLVHGRRKWPSRVDATVLGWLLVPLTVVALTLAWITPAATASLLPLAGPNIAAVRIAATVYVAVLLAINLATFFPTDLRHMRTRRWSYSITYGEAWLRVATNGPLLAMDVALCLLPVAWAAGPAGDRGTLLLLGVFFGVALVHHAYALIGLVAFTVGGAHGGKPLRGARNVVTQLAGVLSIGAAFAWAGVLLWSYVAPFVSLSSAYFGDLVDFAAAGLLTGAGMLGAIALAAMDYAVGIDLVAAAAAAPTKKQD